MNILKNNDIRSISSPFKGLVVGLCLCLSPLAFASMFVEEGPKPVKLMTLEDGSVETSTRHFFGRVTARQTVDLGFQVSGQLEAISVLEGDVVNKGDVIARLDQEPFQISLDRARAQMDQSDRDFNRLKKLQGTGVSKASVEEARTARAIARSALNEAEYAMSKTVMTSPFDAVVASRSISNFSTVAPGIPIIRLHDLSELQIDIDVPEILFQQVGDNPHLDMHAKFPSHDTAYPVEFWELNAEASKIGQTFRVTVAMQPPEGLLLFPGSSVTVIVKLLDQPQTLRVPASALFNDSDGSVSVMRFDVGSDENAGLVKKVPVEVAVADTGVFEIISGLEPGAEVVISGVRDLRDGQSVRRFTSF